jgi:manganese efflux pump family protein
VAPASRNGGPARAGADLRYRLMVLALILVAVSVGLSNLAAAIGLGAGGIDTRTRVRVLVIFGLLEAGMPVVGLLLGHGLASTIGRQTKWVAAVLLVGVGCYGIVKAVRDGGVPGLRSRPRVAATVADAPRPGRREAAKLWITAIALSLDNLAAGFALGTYQVSVVAGVLVFGIVSVLMSLAGLELGARVGRRFGDSGELIGGVALIGVGAAIGLGAFG